MLRFFFFIGTVVIISTQVWCVIPGCVSVFLPVPNVAVMLVCLKTRVELCPAVRPAERGEVETKQTGALVRVLAPTDMDCHAPTISLGITDANI